jgi:hypothetical protein
MYATSMLNPAFLLPFYYYQFHYIKAVMEFKESKGNVASAKKLKRKSYSPFLILLMGFTATSVYNRHKKRQQMQAELNLLTE